MGTPKNIPLAEYLIIEARAAGLSVEVEVVSSTSTIVRIKGVGEHIVTESMFGDNVRCVYGDCSFPVHRTRSMWSLLFREVAASLNK